MWQIHNFDSKWFKILFKLNPLWRPLPITSNKHFMKSFFKSQICAKFIFVRLSNDFIHILYSLYNLTTLGKRNYRFFMFITFNKFVRRHSNDQIIALFFSSPQNIEMSNMKHIEYPSGVTYCHNRIFSIINLDISAAAVPVS